MDKEDIEDFLNQIKDEVDGAIERSYDYVVRAMDDYIVSATARIPLEGHRLFLMEESYTDAFFVVTGQRERLIDLSDVGIHGYHFYKNTFLLFRDAFASFLRKVAEAKNAGSEDYQELFETSLAFGRFCYDAVCAPEDLARCIWVLEESKRYLLETLVFEKTRTE